MALQFEYKNTSKEPVETIRIPVKPGEYTIGPSTEFEFSAAEKSGSVGRIDVEYDKSDKPGRLRIRYVPYWEDGHGKFWADENAATEIDVGDTIEIPVRDDRLSPERGVALSIIEVAEPELYNPEERILFYKSVMQWVSRIKTFLEPGLALPERQRDRQREDIRLVHGGARRQSELMARLGNIVSEKEAALSQSLFDHGSTAITIIASCYLIICLFVLKLSPDTENSRYFSAEMIFVLGIGATMLSTSIYWSSGGMLLLALGTSVAGFLAYGNQANPILVVAGCAVFGGFIGGILESYWLPAPTSARLKVTQGSAIFAMFLLLVTGFGIFVDTQGTYGGILVFVAYLIIIWRLTVVSGLMRRVIQRSEMANYSDGSLGARRFIDPSQLTHNAILLVEAAWIRWRRNLVSRTLAVVLGLVPLLSFLNGFGILDQLQMGVSFVEQSSNNNLWVWIEKGKFLDRKMLQEHKIYYISPHDMRSVEKYAKVGNDKIEGSPGVSLEALLRPYRLLSLDELQSLFNAGQEIYGRINVWTEMGISTSGRTNTVQKSELIPTTRTELKVRHRYWFLLAPIVAVLVGIGVLILWRAASENLTALITGLWAVGAGTMLSLEPFNDFSYFIPIELRGIENQLTLSAAHNLLAQYIHAWSTPFSIAVTILGTLVQLGVITLIVIAHWVLPVRQTFEGQTFGWKIGDLFGWRYYVGLAPMIGVFVLYAVDRLLDVKVLSGQLGNLSISVLFVALSIFMAAYLLIIGRRNKEKSGDGSTPKANISHLVVLLIPSVIVVMCKGAFASSTLVALFFPVIAMLEILFIKLMFNMNGA